MQFSTPFSCVTVLQSLASSLYHSNTSLSYRNVALEAQQTLRHIMRLDILAPVLALVPFAAAHGAVTSYVIGGTTYQGFDGFAPANTPKTIQYPWPDYNPTMTVTDAKVKCNGGKLAQLSATVAAGQNVTAVWKQWTHQQGPVMVWMYKCAGDFSSCDTSGKGWLKIDQMGMWGTQLNSNNWGTAIVYKNLKWSSMVPKNIAPGNYIIRHELIALHQANTPQFYAECAQLVVTGSGKDLPPTDHMFTIPGYAPQSDPGIMVSLSKSILQTSPDKIQVDIYMSKATSYTPPAGNVWSGFQAAA